MTSLILAIKISYIVCNVQAKNLLSPVYFLNPNLMLDNHLKVPRVSLPNEQVLRAVFSSIFLQRPYSVVHR